jgi:toxin ParE1/3/4
VASLRIFWSEDARVDLRTILRYIAARNPPAARRLKSAIEAAVLPVARYPDLFRSGRVAGTREIVAHPNYVIVYHVSDDRIDILNVLHARQEYP